MVFKISFTPNTPKSKLERRGNAVTFLNGTDSLQTVHLLTFAQVGL